EHAWVLRELGLRPARGDTAQSAESVASFGFQWSWDHTPRTEEDLRWRAQERFELQDGFFAGKRLLDAGCGAGAQAAFFAQRGASVTAADLSSAIDVAATRPELREATLIQGDLAHLPLATGSMDVVYCEGVLQHTSELQPVLAELARVLAPGGLLLATHYLKPSGPA